MNIIDMSQVKKSQTLCSNRGTSSLIKQAKRWNDERFKLIGVAENIWQSTANNLVIPDGLICDVEYVSAEGYIETDEYVFISNSDIGNNATAIRVTGKQEGWRYAWEGES